MSNPAGPVARGTGFLEDYALLGLGFLALREATNDPVWSTRAEALADEIVDRFVEESGVVVTTNESSIVPAIDLNDHDTPSGTSAPMNF